MPKPVKKIFKQSSFVTSTPNKTNSNPDTLNQATPADATEVRSRSEQGGAESIRTGSESEELIQTGSESEKPVQTGSELEQPVQTGSDSSEPSQTGPVSENPVPTGSESEKLVETGSPSENPVQTSFESEKAAETGSESESLEEVDLELSSMATQILDSLIQSIKNWANFIFKKLIFLLHTLCLFFYET